MINKAQIKREMEQTGFDELACYRRIRDREIIKRRGGVVSTNWLK